MGGIPRVEQIVGPTEPEAAPQWKAVWALALAAFAVSAAEMMPIAVLTPIGDDVGATAGSVGQALTALAVSAVLTSLLGPLVIRSLNRRYLLLIIAAIQVASSVVVANASGLAGLVVGWALLGVAIGVFWTMTAALAMRLVTPLMVPKALSVVFAGTAIAGLVAPPLGSLLAESVGWRGVFWAVAALALLGLVIQFFTLPSLPATTQLRIGSMLGLLRKRVVLMGMIGIILTFGGQRFFFAYTRPVLDRATGGQVSWVSVLLLLSGIAGLIGTTLSGRFIRRNLMVTMVTAVTLISVLAVVMIWASLGIPTTIPVLMVWAASFAMIPVCWSTWITRAVPEQAEAMGGLQVALVQLSFAITTAIGGGLLDNWGVPALMLAAAVTMAVAAVHLWVFVRPGTRPA
ncbi:MFS transporter [Aestuariimicrobium ganziense]|uniref:MFS transporter n=1 Tax=Aestuariimicrobium ganziense TaxID=2773677 RepID=UPI001940FCAA|nr:MFS transporter [Aestuariimicrobium ganziense]